MQRGQALLVAPLSIADTLTIVSRGRLTVRGGLGLTPGPC